MARIVSTVKKVTAWCGHCELKLQWNQLLQKWETVSSKKTKCDKNQHPEAYHFPQPDKPEKKSAVNPKKVTTAKLRGSRATERWPSDTSFEGFGS